MKATNFVIKQGKMDSHFSVVKKYLLYIIDNVVLILIVVYIYMYDFV